MADIISPTTEMGVFITSGSRSITKNIIAFSDRIHYGRAVMFRRNSGGEFNHEKLAKMYSFNGATGKWEIAHLKDCALYVLK